MMAWLLVTRHARVYRRSWYVFATGFLEPVFYLFSIGIGVGAMLQGFEVGGQLVPYAMFVAPAMLATSAMNGAVMDSTFNIFFRLKYAKLYDALLATPMTTRDIAVGEVTWSLLRGGIYSAGFLLLMVPLGLVTSWTAILALPACLLIGLAFAGIGMWLTTYMTSWQNFEFVTLALMPMTLFSGTFFPVTSFPPVVRWLVEVTPLYRGVVLCRELTTGMVTTASLVSVIYLVALGLLGMMLARRRLDHLLLS
ncbi:MAG: ABC transporter permease [Mobilicoccus sp.]|nr:ABC transporter permease [Mobilicoccus sp.]